MISIEQFKECEIKVGEILSVELVEGSEKLLKLTVNLGDPSTGSGQESKPRTVVSGVRKYFEDPQSLVGVKCAFATNLEPRPLMGLVSEAMLMAASSEDAFSILRVEASVPAGTKVN